MLVVKFLIFLGFEIMSANDLCSLLKGASIVAQDEKQTFLGKVQHRTLKDSVFDIRGIYGDSQSKQSVFNPLGEFGDPTSPYSAQNPHTQTPPLLIKQGIILGFLTNNPNILGGMSLEILQSCNDEKAP